MRVTLAKLLAHVDSETVSTRTGILQYLTYLNEENSIQLPIQDVHRIELLLQIQYQKAKILNELRTEIEEVYVLCDQRLQQDTQVGQLQIQMMNVHKMLRLCLVELTETSETISID